MEVGMSLKRIAAVVSALALIAAIGVLVASTVFAETPTPQAPTTPTTPLARGFGFGGRGLGMWGGGSWTDFDTVAKALNLTPVQLFEQLHSGKTLSDIATAQGVDLQKIQDALNAGRVQAMKDQIAQAVKDGKMTQAQADWLLQGLEQGYMPGGRGSGHGMRGGMRGFDKGGLTPKSSTPAPGTSSS
jgi:hypothetical protein